MYQYPDREKLITGCSFLGDEKDWIGRAILNHLPYFDDMIVVDGSRDGTTEILKHYCSLIIPQGKMPFHAGKFRNLCIEGMSTPWAWFFFPDEIIETTMTPEEVRSMIANSQDTIIRLRRWNMMGSEEKDGYKYPDYQGNIVRDHIRYTLPVHEVPTYSKLAYISMRDWNIEPIFIRHLIRPIDAKYRDNKRWDRKWDQIREESNAQTNP